MSTAPRVINKWPQAILLACVLMGEIKEYFALASVPDALGPSY